MDYTDLINGSEANHKYAIRLLADNKLLELYEFTYNENSHARKLCHLIIPASSYEIRHSGNTIELWWNNQVTNACNLLASKIIPSHT